MRSVWGEGRRVAGSVGVAGLAVAGFASALMLAGGALGQLPLPTTTVTTPSVPSVTVTTPTVPILPTTTVTTPAVPTTTVPTPTVSPPPPPPPASPPPIVAPPSPPPSLPKLPSPPTISTAPPPSIAPQSSPVVAGSAPALSPVASGGSAGATRTSGDGAAPLQGRARTSTTAAAAGAAFGTSAAYRPRQEPPYLVGLPSSGSAALGYGAFIIPTGGAEDLRTLRGGAVRGVPEVDILALLGLPDFLRPGRAQAVRRAGNPLSDVERVLGEQATLADVGEGGGLRFGHLPLLALALVLLSSFLLVGAVVPPGVVARTPFSPTNYARFREPMALASIGILVPVVVVALVVALG